MSIVGALVIRLTHTGLKPDGSLNLSSVTLYDLDEPTASVTRSRAVPVPVGSGTTLPPVDIAMSTRTFLSWAKGAICKFVQNGYLTAELILQLRDKGHCGGPAGTGQNLRSAVLNAERIGNVLRLVIPNNVSPALGSVGFLINEEVEATGFSGVFSGLDGAYTISTAVPGTGLAGLDPGSYLLEFNSEGPDLVPTTLAGVNLCLVNGRVTVEMNSNGDAGGLGANVFGYIGGQSFPKEDPIFPPFLEGGPLLSGAFREILPAASPFPTLVTWWDSPARNYRLVETEIVRSGGAATNITPTPIIWRFYDNAGSLQLTVSDEVLYSGIFKVIRVPEYQAVKGYGRKRA